jgi:EAL domain-containing protein (putative c-di-GMP-specific phosphodiesterase class I)/AmiR/NasT family two-component response regulator
LVVTERGDAASMAPSGGVAMPPQLGRSEPLPTSTPSLAPFSGMRVLVVDDNEINLAIVKALLEARGLAEVRTESDARRVPARLELDSPDLVLLDLHMPHVSGFETLRDIQRHAAGSYLPVLVLTADTTTDARDRAFAQGAQDYLTKPLDTIELTLRVANLLRTRALYADLRRTRPTRPTTVLDAASVEVPGDRVATVLKERTLRSVYQRVVDVDSLATVGYEALSRFDDASLRTPDLWFAEAFAVGSGVELEWLAATIALDGLSWLPENHFLSVNMSPSTVLRLAEHDLCPADAWQHVVIELTEHEVVEDYDVLHRALAVPRAHGARLAADDLGSGYAGLRQLLLLQPDIIKLDISLVHDIQHSPAQRALARALLSFATEVGACVIAEGVGDAAELAVLRDLGAPWAQGFLLGRPLPAEVHRPAEDARGVPCSVT